jgi:CBS domain containing-hemolysin-like protein
MSEPWHELGWPLLVIALLLLVNGFFVAAEFALAAAPETRIGRLAEGGSAPARRLLAVLRNSRAFNNYISTAQVGITLASLGLGMYGEHAIAEWLAPRFAQWGAPSITAAHTLATLVTVIILTYLHIVVGEMVPKSLALAAPDVTALRIAGWMRLAKVLFHPLTSLLDWSGDTLLRLAGIPPIDAKARLVSSAELEYIVEESAESGLLEPTEQLYLENVLDFGERTVGQVMTPRTRMQALPVDANLDETLQTFYEHGYSRYPVYEGDRDEVIGVLYVKDLARQLSEGATEIDLRTLIRPAVYTPETVLLEQLLQRFRSEHIQIAIVVDEFGGTAGLVTLEDLVEELIGEIQDEFDEELPPLEEIGPNTLRVRGDLLIEELNQHYALALDEEIADTVGGLVMAALGNIPAVGEVVVIDGVRFDVETIEGRAIGTLIVHLPVPEQTLTPSSANKATEAMVAAESVCFKQSVP